MTWSLGLHQLAHLVDVAVRAQSLVAPEAIIDHESLVEPEGVFAAELELTGEPRA